MVTSDDVIRILRDIVLGLSAPSSEPEELAELRKRMSREVDAIREAGGVVEIPAEMPGDN